MKKYIIMIIILTIFFGGISDIKEITDIGIVYSQGIDMEDGKYKLTTLVLDPSNENEKSKGTIYTTVGESIQEICRDVSDQSPKSLYLAHMESLIISEEIAKESFLDVADFFIRDNEGSNQFHVIVVKDNTAEEIIECINEEEIHFSDIIDNSHKYKGKSSVETLNDNFKDIFRPGKELALTCVSINDDKLEIQPMAYFDDDKLKGYLDEENSIMYNLLRNNIKNTIVVIGEKEERVVFEIISSKIKIGYNKKTMDFDINGKISVNIVETGLKATLKDKKDIERAQSELKNSLEEKINTYVDNCKNEYKLDLIGFGNILYRKKIDLYTKEDYLKDVKVSTNINVKIANQGGVIKQW